VVPGNKNGARIDNDMKKMITLAGLAVAALLVIPGANAAPIPACTSNTGTLQSFVNQGSCSYNGFIFDFLNSSVSAGAASPATTSANLNNNTNVALSVLDPFNVRVDFTSSTSKWTAATNATIVSFGYAYNITAIANLGAAGSTLTIFNANTNSPGLTSGTKNVSGNVVAVSDNDNNLATFENLTGSTSFAPVVGTANVTDTLNVYNFGALQGFVGDATHPGMIRNDLNFVIVPEPVTMLVSGIGLVGLGLLRRRSKKA
jgi:hypothetical protein